MNHRIDLSPLLSQYAHLPILPESEQVRLVKVAQRGGYRGREAREKLIRHNLRFVIKLAGKWSGYRSDGDDLVAEGMMALNRAIDKFKPGKKVKLTSYAAHWLNSKMGLRCMYDYSLVRIGKSDRERELFWRIKGYDNTSASPEGEMARRGGTFYLDKEVPGTSGIKFLDYLKGSSGSSEEELIGREESEKMDRRLKLALSHLDERERKVITMRFLGEEKMTLSEIGEEGGYSREWVRKIQNAALKKMTRALGLKTSAQDVLLNLRAA